jgi:hypothetical protein
MHVMRIGQIPSCEDRLTSSPSYDSNCSSMYLRKGIRPHPHPANVRADCFRTE